MRRSLLLLLAFVAPCLVSCAETGSEPRKVPGPVRFYREHVAVEPSEGRTRVVGHYFFRNSSDDSVTVAMSYPFPVDLHHARPFKVCAWRRRDGELRPLGFHHEPDSIRWRLSFLPREEQEIRVEYVQQVSREHAVYIVTTTGEWGEPIELAEFEFRVPTGLGEIETSFEPDSVEDRGDTVIYHLRRTNFMPEADLEMWWE